jgi:hypothetical protein
MSSPKTRLTAFERHRRTFGLQIILLIGLAALPFLPALNRLVARPWAVSKATNTKGKTINLARLSQSVSVRAAGRGNRTINLSDGREVLTSYARPEELQQALAQNRAQPLSLASQISMKTAYLIWSAGMNTKAEA